MKIVIDIPDKEFQACVRRDANMTGGIADNYIANGTVLPKGHGDLIDRDALIGELWWVDDCPHIKLGKNAIDIWEEINTANAVIPADSETD